MVLVTDVLPEKLSRPLLQYDIRFVEQFLSMMRRPANARALAHVLGYSVENLQAVAHAVETERPDLAVPDYSGHDYSLGYGKRADLDDRF